MHSIRSTVRFFIILVLIFLSCTGSLVSAQQPPLILALHPFLPLTELHAKFEPLARLLENRLGREVQVRVGSSYAEHIRYIGRDRVDIAYMGPASFVKMEDEYGPKPLLARLEIDGQPWFQGKIITRTDSDIQSIKDLRGRRIAYGDPNSTMSYIVPHNLLLKAGVYDDKKTLYQFLNSHDNVALGVLAGDFDAGAMKPAVFQKYRQQGLRSILDTPRISEHLFVTRSNLPIRLINQLRDILLNMHLTREGMSALQAIKPSITALVKVEAQNYDSLRQIIHDAADRKE